MEQKARIHSSPIVKKLLAQIPVERKTETSVRMQLIAEVDNLIKKKGWDKCEFADQLNEIVNLLLTSKINNV